MDITFGNGESTSDVFKNAIDIKTSINSQVSIKSKSNKKPAIFPTSRFRRLGAKVINRGNGSFEVIFSDGRYVTSSKLSDTFIYKILINSDEDELINIPENPIWDIKRMGNNKFFIVRN